MAFKPSSGTQVSLPILVTRDFNFLSFQSGVFDLEGFIQSKPTQLHEALQYIGKSELFKQFVNTSSMHFAPGGEVARIDAGELELTVLAPLVEEADKSGVGTFQAKRD